MPPNIIAQKSRELARELNKLPREVKALGVQFFKSRFRAGGWYDRTFMPWKKRRRNGRGKQNRAILVQSGRLRNSIRGTVSGTDVTFGSDVPYAAVHNNGGTITRYARSETFVRRRISKGKRKGQFKKGTDAGRGITFKGGQTTMPKRQFIGESAHFNKLITRTIENKVKRVFR